jgi:YD repeat-containing protein
MTDAPDTIRVPQLDDDDKIPARFLPAGIVPDPNPALAVVYNGAGQVSSTTEGDVTTTFTYNADGTVHTQTVDGVTRTFQYDTNGRVTGAI